MGRNFVLVEIDEEGMLVDVEGGRTFFLNETGLIIYKMLNKNRTEEEIKKRILSDFDAHAEEVGNDVKFFRDLLKRKEVL